MKFIEYLEKAFEQALDNLNQELEKYAPKNWCIGSGSNFTVYQNITSSQAEEIFEKLDVRQCCGKLIDAKTVGYFTVETYATMESSSGQTTLFMFPINEIIKRSKKNEKQTINQTTRN